MIGSLGHHSIDWPDAGDGRVLRRVHVDQEVHGVEHVALLEVLRHRDQPAPAGVAGLGRVRDWPGTGCPGEDVVDADVVVVARPICLRLLMH